MADPDPTPNDSQLEGVCCEVRWLPLEQDAARHPLRCIDGRYTAERVGAPGGDMGEFLLLVAALEQLHQEPRSPEWIDAALTALIDAFSPFHMHTDEAALERFAAAYAPDRAEQMSVEEIEEVIRHPAADERERIEALLVEPDLQGCGHLNVMMHDPDGYGLDLATIQRALRVFYHRLWEGSSKVDLEVLLGVHTEEAVVVVEHADETAPEGHAPALVVDDNEGASIFVEHPRTRHEQRRRFLDALVRHDLVDEDAARSTLWEKAEELEAVHRDKTIEALCPDLPVHRIEV